MKAIKAKATIEEVYKGMFGLTIPESIKQKLPKRVVVTLNKELNIHAAIQTRKVGDPYIYLSKKYIKELKLKIGSAIDVTIKHDESKYAFEESEELNEVLKTDPVAAKKFKDLTDGNKRSLIFLVTKLKSVEKRIEQAIHICNCLHAGITNAQQIVKTKKQAH